MGGRAPGLWHLECSFSSILIVSFEHLYGIFKHPDVQLPAFL